jgi:hypothetical protein
MINICRKCGKVLCVCLPFTVGVVVPVIEAINSPPEECRLSAPCSWGDLWAPHNENPDYTTSQPTIEPVAETGGAATVPWGGSDAANSLPPYRQPWIAPALILD